MAPQPRAARLHSNPRRRPRRPRRTCDNDESGAQPRPCTGRRRLGAFMHSHLAASHHGPDQPPVHTKFCVGALRTTTGRVRGLGLGQGGDRSFAKVPAAASLSASAAAASSVPLLRQAPARAVERRARGPAAPPRARATRPSRPSFRAARKPPAAAAPPRWAASSAATSPGPRPRSRRARARTQPLAHVGGALAEEPDGVPQLPQHRSTSLSPVGTTMRRAASRPTSSSRRAAPGPGATPR